MKENHSPLIIRLFGFNQATNWVVVVVTLLVYIAPVITAQNGTVPSPPVGYPLDPNIKVSPSMAIILVCLISVFFLMGFFSVYIRRCAERHTAQSYTLAADGGGSGRIWRPTAARGLDPAVIDTIPTFIYSQSKGLKIGRASLECAVCLNEFEDDETLRLLPKCSHVFHPNCIDAWLDSHITCPVCRSNVVPKPGEVGLATLELSHDSDGESGHDPHNQNLIIDVQSPDVINTSQTPNHNRPPVPTPTTTNTRISEKFPRSHSTGHSLVHSGENCERFTLRLPEEVRNRLVNSSLTETKSYVALPRVRSSRKGYRCSSGGTGHGRDNFNYEWYRFDGEGPSDRLSFMTTPPGSAPLPKVAVGV